MLAKASEFGGRHGLVFPSEEGRELSAAILSRLLRDLGIATVPNGFRASFRAWCAEIGVARTVIGACLAYAPGSEASYFNVWPARYEARIAVMKDWATYLRW